MSSKTKKLGALADIYQREHLDGSITKLKLHKIFPSEHQPRTDRTKGVSELASSLDQDGLLSPLVVTKENEKYRIIAGERRFHAAKSLGWNEIECKIISRKERDYKRIALVENLQREGLTAIEEATALLGLKKQEDLSDADLGKTIGKSRNYVTEILGIAALPQEIMQACSEAGIQNKNILIAAVQSWKKGQINQFIHAFKSGNIKTVKQAKAYNQAGQKQATNNTTEKPSIDRLQSTYSIAVNGSRVVISCQTPSEAKKIASAIKKANLP